MALTYGFYNSINGDRKYDARQMASIFDGIIMDGVFQSIGTAMMVTPVGDLTVNVGVGRAWFNHSWTYNDAVLNVALEPADTLQNRIDEIVLEHDATDGARRNRIIVVKGVPNSKTPERPPLVKDLYKVQYSLASIYRGSNTNTINSADITNRVGTSETPFVTGPLKTISIDGFVSQWSDQWNNWFNNTTAAKDASFDSWRAQQTTDFNAWFTNLQNQLTTNQAGNLQTQVDALNAKFLSFERDKTLYQTLQDSNGNSITDNNGLVVQGKIVYQIAS